MSGWSFIMFRIAALLCSVRLLLLMCFPYVRLQLNQTTVAILIWTGLKSRAGLHVGGVNFLERIEILDRVCCVFVNVFRSPPLIKVFPYASECVPLCARMCSVLTTYRIRLGAVFVRFNLLVSRGEVQLLCLVWGGGYMSCGGGYCWRKTFVY
jgi:hypothetical protein